MPLFSVFSLFFSELLSIRNISLLFLFGCYLSFNAQDTINASWAFNEGGEDYDFTISKTTLDAEGNLYATGKIHHSPLPNSSNYQVAKMRGILNLPTGISQDEDAMFLVKYDRNGEKKWLVAIEFEHALSDPSETFTFPYQDVDLEDFNITGITIDESNGHVFVSGNFKNTILFNSIGGSAAVLSTPHTNIKIVGRDSANPSQTLKEKMYPTKFFVSEYTSSGRLVNTFTDGGEKAFVVSNDIKVDNGNVYVTGYFFGERIKFGDNGGANFNTISSSLENFFLEHTWFNKYELNGQGTRAFLASYQTDGELNWIRMYEGTGTARLHVKQSRSRGLGICFDNNHNPVMVGAYVKNTRPTGAPQSAIMTYNTSHDLSNIPYYDRSEYWLDNLFVAEYSGTNGNLHWYNTITKTGIKDICIANDANGNTILTGHSGDSDSLDFTSANSNPISISTPSHKVPFIAKYNRNGHLSWVNKILSDCPFNLGGLATDDLKIYALGTCYNFYNMHRGSNAIDFTGVSSNITLPNSTDRQKGMYIAEYTSAGDPIKAFREGGANHQGAILSARGGSLYISSVLCQPTAGTILDGDGILSDTLDPIARGTHRDDNILVSKYMTLSCADYTSFGVGMQNGQLGALAKGAILANMAASCQWYRNGNSIPGATSPSYDPTQPGIYSLVLVTNDGCILSSSSYTHFVVEQGDIDFESPIDMGASYAKSKTIDEITNQRISSYIMAYPNPFSDQIIIKVTANESSSAGSYSLRIADILGREVLEKNVFIKEGNNTIVFNNLSRIVQGTYILTVMDQNGNYLYSEKLLK